MGNIKEPKGVDFVIESAPLTDKARKEISEFISNYKKRSVDKKPKSVSSTKKRKTVPV